MSDNDITDSEWEDFFDVMERIVKQEGGWQEKKLSVEEKAKENDAENALEEFGSWFD